MTMQRDEKGIALVITLFLMASLSALAVSMMFLAHTETAASRNYRTMSQARYAAEAGIHKAANYLMNTYPATVPASPFNGYDTTKSPVTCTSGCAHTTTTTCNPATVTTAVATGCIVLSAMPGISSNYPDTTVATAFNTAIQGTLAVNSSGTTATGGGTVTYAAAAILMSMRAVTAYGSGTSVIQTWQLVSDGTVPPSTAAIVEVSASVEREYGPAETYSIFATGQGCGAVQMDGNASTNSYNSSTMSTTPPSTSDFSSSGDIGTNGNLNVDNAVTISGSLSTPRTGVGQCKAGGNVPAVTGGGKDLTNIQKGISQLSQAVSYPTPDLPNPMPLPGAQPISASAATCDAIKISNPTLNLLTGCTVSGTTVSVITNGSTPLLLSDVTVASGVTLSISYGSGGTAAPGTALVNVNSLTLSGSSTVALGTGTSIYMNVAGKTATGDLSNPLSFSGGADVNPSYDPSRFQILYAGTGELDVTGNNTVSATIYAPNAFVKTSGNSEFYGSILSKTFKDAGTTDFHYDTNLKKKLFTIGNYVMTSFSWKKY